MYSLWLDYLGHEQDIYESSVTNLSSNEQGGKAILGPLDTWQSFFDSEIKIDDEKKVLAKAFILEKVGDAKKFVKVFTGTPFNKKNVFKVDNKLNEILIQTFGPLGIDFKINDFLINWQRDPQKHEENIVLIQSIFLEEFPEFAQFLDGESGQVKDEVKDKAKAYILEKVGVAIKFRAIYSSSPSNKDFLPGFKGSTDEIIRQAFEPLGLDFKIKDFKMHWQNDPEKHEENIVLIQSIFLEEFPEFAQFLDGESGQVKVELKDQAKTYVLEKIGELKKFTGIFTGSPLLKKHLPKFDGSHSEALKQVFSRVGIEFKIKDFMMFWQRDPQKHEENIVLLHSIFLEEFPEFAQFLDGESGKVKEGMMNEAKAYVIEKIGNARSFVKVFTGSPLNKRAIPGFEGSHSTAFSQFMSRFGYNETEIKTELLESIKKRKTDVMLHTNQMQKEINQRKHSPHAWILSELSRMKGKGFGEIANRMNEENDGENRGVQIAKEYEAYWRTGQPGQTVRLERGVIHGLMTDRADHEKPIQVTDLSASNLILARTLAESNVNAQVMSLDTNPAGLIVGDETHQVTHPESTQRFEYDVALPYTTNLPDRSSDITVLSLALHYAKTEERDLIMREMTRVTKDEGHVVLTLPKSQLTEESFKELVQICTQYGLTTDERYTGHGGAVDYPQHKYSAWVMTLKKLKAASEDYKFPDTFRFEKQLRDTSDEDYIQEVGEGNKIEHTQFEIVPVPTSVEEVAIVSSIDTEGTIYVYPDKIATPAPPSRPRPFQVIKLDPKKHTARIEDLIKGGYQLVLPDEADERVTLWK